ncbi:hypothetical protein P3L10_004068 [Capsicum annuum]
MTSHVTSRRFTRSKSFVTVPRTVEEVFTDLKARRAGLIKALTADVEKFYQ